MRLKWKRRSSTDNVPQLVHVFGIKTCAIIGPALHERAVGGAPASQSKNPSFFRVLDLTYPAARSTYAL